MRICRSIIIVMNITSEYNILRSEKRNFATQSMRLMDFNDDDFFLVNGTSRLAPAHNNNIIKTIIIL